MKTAMQELIEDLQNLCEEIDDRAVLGINYGINMAVKKLEAEKQKTEDAYIAGEIRQFKSFADYYSKTYLTP